MSSGADPRGRGGGGGGPRRAPPPPPPAIGKNMIFLRKIMIFHTKFPQKIFKYAPPTWNPGSAPGLILHYNLICLILCIPYPRITTPIPSPLLSDRGRIVVLVEIKCWNCWQLIKVEIDNERCIVLD